MGLKRKSTDAGNLDMSKGSREVLLLSEKVRAHKLIRKEKNRMLRLIRSSMRISRLSVKL